MGRIYYIERQAPDSKQWIRGTKLYESCAKAHRAARRLPGAVRVLMQMSKRTLADLKLALRGRKG